MSCGWNKVIPYTIGSVSGILLILYFSDIINGCKYTIRKGLYYIENHTYEILALHIISFKVVSLLIVILYNMNSSHIAEHSVIANIPDNIPWWFFYSIIGVIVPLLLCKLYYIVYTIMKYTVVGCLQR